MISLRSEYYKNKKGDLNLPLFLKFYINYQYPRIP